jgi:arabinan endo-1,5-alpha-L-arabinosidase
MRQLPNHPSSLKALALRALCSLCLLGSWGAHAKQVDVHDPVMAKDGNTFYVFSTGPGITFYSSKNLKDWRKEGEVFSSPPAMARQVAAEFAGHLWAPDVQFHKGKYYLYYSASAFGKNTSGIGVAVNKTLNPKAPDYHWQDLGTVIQSIPGRDDWNAIDSNIIEDEQGNGWMAFGSFWSGLKMFKLNADWTKPAEPQEWHNLAERPRTKTRYSQAANGTAETAPSDAGNGAIEAPFIFKKGGYYYLFVSFDKCCKGKDSDYNIRVGRSKSATGPYVDKAGTDLRDGGGSLVLGGDADWVGLGHNSAYTFDGKDYLVFHAYETADKYLQKLKVLELTWDADAWPVVDPKQLANYRTRLR